MRTRPSGFTLIELMVAVAILGLLSSIAIPSFRNFQLRSKRAERTMVMEMIRRGVEDYWLRETRFPTDWGGGWSYLNLWNANPDANPGTAKRPWRRTRVNASDNWPNLTFTMEGGVYYSYYGFGVVEPAAAGLVRYYYIIADGDLDGDGRVNQIQRLYLFERERLYRYAGAPPDGQISYEWDLGGGTF